MDLLQGTLDMLVLRTLIIAPLHGYRVAKAIRNNSGETLDIELPGRLKCRAKSSTVRM